MPWLISTIFTGAIAFIATNIDDLIVLMVFFSQVNATFRKPQVYLGQYLGFITLVFCSLPGFFGGLVVPKAWIGLLGLFPIVLGIRALLNRDEDEDEVQNANVASTWLGRSLSRLVNPKTLGVAAVTFANGGDNIGIYVPLFATTNLYGLLVILGVFFALVGIWCGVADWLANHPTIAPVLTRYSHIIVPFVLIGLGIYILFENETWRLVTD